MMRLRFGHPSEAIEFWSGLVRPLLSVQPTPFYLFSQVPVDAALAELSRHLSHLPIRHWLSCKTQPLKPLLQVWRRQERPVEVVSEFEFLAALHAGFSSERILLNGPAKHRWLPKHALRGMRVNFDSLSEVRELASLARKLDWMVGVRVNTSQEYDPERPEFPTQFGMTEDEVGATVSWLKRRGLSPRIAHFHLRTNVASAAIYERALAELAVLCRRVGMTPEFVDCGGGFPPPYVLTSDGKRVDAKFSLTAMAGVYERALGLFPGVREIWLENGRWLSARSGVLVVKVLDVKERRGMRHLICDGGRTTNALVSNWEAHELVWLPAGDLKARGISGAANWWRSASEKRRPSKRDSVFTVVTGPTCMAFDQLARRALPRAIQPGDYFMWMEAGAYHLSWETRFSHGLAAVLWHDGRRIRQVRKPERFASWWDC